VLRPQPTLGEATEQAPAPAVAATPAPTASATAPTPTAPAATVTAGEAAERAAADRARAAGARQEDAVLRDLRAGRVSVLVLWDRGGADDRAARRAALGLDRRDGRVRVHVAPVARVAGFARITRSVAISQAPTTIVISPRGRARTVVGITEHGEVDQLVRDALARP